VNNGPPETVSFAIDPRIEADPFFPVSTANAGLNRFHQAHIVS
jgi:hypothetical protein